MVIAVHASECVPAAMQRMTVFVQACACHFFHGLLQSPAINEASLPDESAECRKAMAQYELRDLPGRRLRRWLRCKHSAECGWGCRDN
jgi:hypothetical protein